MKYLSLIALIAMPAGAAPYVLLDGARDVFPDQPRIVKFSAADTPCGFTNQSHPQIGYCASQRVLYLRDDVASSPSAAYEVAHVMGHYYQIRYGVADVALRTIRARRDDEDALRGMVTRQVECLAGVVMAAAELPFVPLDVLFDDEPFTGSHWGGRMGTGPRVSIGLDARAEWYETGYRAGDVAACSVGEMSADLLIAKQR